MSSLRNRFPRLKSLYTPAIAALLAIAGGILRSNATEYGGGITQGATAAPATDAQTPEAPPNQDIFQKRVPANQLAFLSGLAGEQTRVVLHRPAPPRMPHH